MSSILTPLPPPLPQDAVRPEFSQRFGRLLGSVYRKWRRLVDAEFRQYGFSDATRSPLIALNDYDGPMRQRDLAQHLGLEASALVRIITILEGRGMVHCEPDESDRRSKNITLTDAGRQWAEFILRKSYEIELRILRDLSQDEVDTARRALNIIHANIPDG